MTPFLTMHDFPPHDCALHRNAYADGAAIRLESVGNAKDLMGVVALDCVNATRDYVQARTLVLARFKVPADRLANAGVPFKELATAMSLPLIDETGGGRKPLRNSQRLERNSCD